jgi:hypothetical protein
MKAKLKGPCKAGITYRALPLMILTLGGILALTAFSSAISASAP